MEGFDQLSKIIYKAAVIPKEAKHLAKFMHCAGFRPTLDVSIFDGSDSIPS